MPNLEAVAMAAVNRDALILRSLTQDFLKEFSDLSLVPAPQTEDQLILTTSAALIELLAVRSSQLPPSWAAGVGPSTEDYFLVAAAERMRHLRQLCITESPEPLRRRRLFAPPDFLMFV